MTFIFKYFGFVKTRRKIYVFLLNIIKPYLILDVHWLSEPSKIHWIWDKLNGNKSKFIVIQHGIYTGGTIIRLFDETNPRTYNFWVWSEYFKNQFSQIFNEQGKFVNIKVLGNPVYNKIDRNQWNYNLNSNIKSILISPTESNSVQAFWYKKFIYYLLDNQIEVHLKLHNFQDVSYFSGVENLITKMNIYDLLKSNSFDLIVSDVSTVLLDAIFYKNAVLYFQPFENDDEFILKNVYVEFLNNYFIDFRDCNFDIDEIENYVQLESQELLFSKLVYTGTNSILT